MGRLGAVFGFDDGQHRGHVGQLEWKRLAVDLGTFLGVLLAGRLVTGDAESPWVRAGIVAVALATVVVVRRRRQSWMSSLRKDSASAR